MATDDYWSGISGSELRALVPNVVLKEVSDGKVEFKRTDDRGIMMFIDISGFSALSTRMQVRSEGVDTLTVILNKHLSDMIDIIREKDGDIILFSGDALLVAWQASGDMSVLRAVSCAVGLQQHQYNEIDSLKTAVHIGIAIGNYTVVILGGKGPTPLGAYRYAVIGPAVNNAAYALNVAGENEIVADKGVNDVLSKLQNIECQEVEPNYYRIKGDTTQIKPKHQHVLSLKHPSSHVVRAFCFDTVAWCLYRKALGEIRTVSSVFIKLSSLKELPLDTAIEKLQTSVCLIQKALSQSEGILNKVGVDDKGWVVLCLFGLPLHTHEDDTDRSVRFAVRAVSKVGRVAGRMAVGISRAKVYCGLTGNSARQEYTALGDGVNIAARLMSKADAMCTDSGIYTDEETFANCVNSRRYGVEFRQVGNEGLMLKGSSVPVIVYELETFDPSGQGMTSVALEGIHESDSGSLSNSSGSFNRLNGGRAASLISNKTAKSQQRSRMKYSSDSILSDDSASSKGSRSSRSSGISPRPRAKLFSSPRGTGAEGKRGGRVNKSSAAVLSLNGSVSPDSPSLAPQIIPISKQKMFGRNTEINLITAYVQGAARRVAQDSSPDLHKILNIAGNSQSGMSTLLDAAESIGLLHGLHPFRICGLESAEFVPYYALVPVLMGFLDNLSIQFIELSLPPELRKHMPLLHHVTRVPGLSLPTDMHSVMEPSEKIATLNQLMRALTRKYYGDRILILVDDAQWLDDQTWSYLADCVNNGTKMIIANRHINQCLQAKTYVDIESRSVSTHSTDHGIIEQGLIDAAKDQAEQFREFLQSSSKVDRVVLERLSKAVVIAIMNSVFGSMRCSHALESLVYEKSDGRPGFVVQMAASLKFAALVEVRDKVAQPTSSITEFQEMLVHTVPSIEAYTMKRYDTLGNHDRLVASLLATINTCSEQCLQQILAAYGSSESVNGAVDNLVATGIAKKEGNQIMFGLSLGRDVIYYSCLEKEKKLLHSAVVRVIFDKPEYTDKEVAAHVEASSLSKEEVMRMFHRYHDRAYEEHDIKGCMSALGRVPDIGTPEENYFKKLKISGFWNELGNVHQAKQVIKEVVANRRSMFKSKSPEKRSKLCCCMRHFRKNRRIGQKTLFKLQYHVLQLELNMWCCEGEAGKSRLEILENLVQSLPLDMTQFLKAADLVFNGKPYSEMSEGYPFTVFAGCGSWECLSLFERWSDIPCTGIHALPVTWVDEEGHILGSRGSKYSPTQFWRPSVKGLLQTTHALVKLLTGEPVKPRSPEHAYGKWGHYHSIMCNASAELCFSGDSGSLPILRVGEGRLAWISESEQQDTSSPEDTISNALVSCLRACSFSQTGSWNVKLTHAAVRNAMQVTTPFHCLMMWLFSEALQTTSKRSSAVWSSPVSSSVPTQSTSSNSAEQSIGLVTTETSSDDFRSSHSDIPITLNSCMAMFGTLASLYPIASLSYRLMMGELCEYEREARYHYKLVLENAHKLGVPMCPLAWRARARILSESSLDDAGKAAVCMHTPYDPSADKTVLVTQLLNDVAGHPVSASHEAKELESYLARAPDHTES